MHLPLSRLLSVALLLTWMAPSVEAFGVGLHLALDHHGSHGAELERDFSDLARAVTHGHHHDVGAAPHHEHRARVGGKGATVRSDPSLVAALPSPPSTAAVPGERWRLDRSQRRGPPAPLFAAHSSLLL